YPVQIDKTGVLYKGIGGNTNFELPIVSGLPVEYMAGGMRIPSTYRPLIDQINKIEKLSQNYFASISEICVVSKDSGNYELEIIPSNSKVKVLTDRTLNEEALKYMMVVLDVVDTINADVSELDLRYGSVSIK
nr:cell division protein FtsQ [Treponema sp.]